MADANAFIDKIWPHNVPIPYFSPDDGSDKLAEWVNDFLNHLQIKNSIIANIYRSQPDGGEEPVLALLKKVGRRLRHQRKTRLVYPVQQSFGVANSSPRPNNDDVRKA
jgi:hypothetical protein